MSFLAKRVPAVSYMRELTVIDHISMKSEEEAVLRLGFGPYDANGARDLLINRSKFVF